MLHIDAELNEISSFWFICNDCKDARAFIACLQLIYRLNQPRA
jgi:hypothetical protein